MEILRWVIILESITNEIKEESREVNKVILNQSWKHQIESENIRRRKSLKCQKNCLVLSLIEIIYLQKHMEVNLEFNQQFHRHLHENHLDTDQDLMQSKSLSLKRNLEL